MGRAAVSEGERLNLWMIVVGWIVARWGGGGGKPCKEWWWELGCWNSGYLVLEIAERELRRILP